MMTVMLKSLPEAAVADTAARLSLWARLGDVILLRGDLGVGKSVFARSFIRSVADDPQLEVPSPSFPLIQTYDQLRLPVAHVDLYRLKSPEEVFELGLSELAKSHILLIEWPDRLPEGFFDEGLAIQISGQGDQRDIQFDVSPSWAPRLVRDQQLQDFLAQALPGVAPRNFLEGDASSRRYETLGHDILMDMPRRPDGPIVKTGKPYSAIAHLAEDISAVVSVNDYLLSRSYSAPSIKAVDLEHGFAVMENLGDHVYGRLMQKGCDMAEPFAMAIKLLVDMAAQDWPERVDVRGQKTHPIADYDDEALLIEVDLLLSWYWPAVKGETISSTQHDHYVAIWRRLLPHVKTDRPVWVLRDFHSPNLIWLPQRKDIARVGLIDTQDAVRGHPAYDLVSFLQDARLDFDVKLAHHLFADYCRQRGAGGEFDEAAFTKAYAILGAQRATKILGIFTRLAVRDGKPQYLRHIPRVMGYLKANLEHPALRELKSWHEANLPLYVAERENFS